MDSIFLRFSQRRLERVNMFCLSLFLCDPVEHFDLCLRNHAQWTVPPPLLLGLPFPHRPRASLPSFPSLRRVRPRTLHVRSMEPLMQVSDE